MKTVWKYELAEEDEQIISMPHGAEFLSVQMQGNIPCLWAKVNTKNSLFPVRVVTHGTGHAADDTDGMQFVGTYQQFGGSLVFHVWCKEE